MASNENDPEDKRPDTDRKAEDWGRKAARLLRRGRPQVEKALNDARPRIERAVNEARPRVEKALNEARPHVEQAVNQARPRAERAAKQAWQYTQEHEDDIKRAALRGARMKVRGPFAFVFDAFQSGFTSSAGVQCPACQASNEANARFCAQCGARLNDKDQEKPQAG